jgi:hypothetical protein
MPVSYKQAEMKEDGWKDIPIMNISMTILINTLTINILKIKSCPCFSLIKYYAMKAYGGMHV